MIDAYNASDESFREGHVVRARTDSGLPDYLFRPRKSLLAACADMDFSYRPPVGKLVYPPARPPLTDEEMECYMPLFFGGDESDGDYVGERKQYVGRDEFNRSVYE